jgi:hypothetical protein
VLWSEALTEHIRLQRGVESLSFKHDLLDFGLDGDGVLSNTPDHLFTFAYFTLVEWAEAEGHVDAFAAGHATVKFYMEANRDVRGQLQLVFLVKMESVEVTAPLGAGTPRQVASLPVSVDEGLRAIRDFAVKLLVPQPVVATAQTFFHRVKSHAALCRSVALTMHFRCRSLPRLQGL